MLVILICIHRLQRGRHKLFSDLFPNDSQIHIYSIQAYGTIVISVLFSFFYLIQYHIKTCGSSSVLSKRQIKRSVFELMGYFVLVMKFSTSGTGADVWLCISMNSL